MGRYTADTAQAVHMASREIDDGLWLFAAAEYRPPTQADEEPEALPLPPLPRAAAKLVAARAEGLMEAYLAGHNLANNPPLSMAELSNLCASAQAFARTLYEGVKA